MSGELITPREKARELIEMFYEVLGSCHDRWKATGRCAMIAAESRIDSHADCSFLRRVENTRYWQSVKVEINNIMNEMGV